MPSHPDTAEREAAAVAGGCAPTRTLEKGLFLLGLFDQTNPEWSLRELRDRSGFPKATVRRLMKTLEASNWVTYDPVNGKFHLGSSALRALYLATSHSELVRVAHPFLLELAEETTESALIAVWTDQGPMILDTVPTSRHFKPHTSIGMLLTGYASADAQVMIAFGPRQREEAVLAAPQERRTEYTVTDPKRLRARWQQVRRDGVAFDHSEWRIGAPAVSAPVFDQNGGLRCSVTVVAPPERCSEEQMQSYAAAVRRTAALLSAALGYKGTGAAVAD